MDWPYKKRRAPEAAPGAARKTYGSTWWGKQWLQALTEIDFSNRQPRGRNYANKGLARDLVFNGNMISAKVKGSGPSPYKVQITVLDFDKSTQERLVQIVADNPLFLSKLLNRELPPELNLNLTAASNVIHYDLWWNPAVEAQATDRAFRIGQQRNVQVHRFITQGTFEERINAMLQSKKELANLTVAAGEKWVGELSDGELRDLVRLGG